MKTRVSLFTLACVLGHAASASECPPFRLDKLAAMDVAIEAAISAGKCPGGVLWLEHRGAGYDKTYGARALEPDCELMTEDTIFDAASLTKVMATTPAVLLLIERGKIDLDAPASCYWPEFTGSGKEAITIHQLLAHTSGLRPGVPPIGEPLTLACAEVPSTAPELRFRYSDINFIVLGEIVHRVSGQSLDAFCAAEIFAPLGMHDTGFRPDASLLPRVAPTERGVPRGIVHDPTARRMNGVAGHAGLFTTAADLARYARMYLHGGTLDGVRFFQPATLELMTRVQTPCAINEMRGLGWDINSPYAGPRGEHFPVGGYGHTGWTGGSLWIDPASESFVIFLSNRNHPTEAGSVIALRKTLGTLAAEAIQ